MKNKTLIVGDLHGRKEVAEKVFKSGYKAVFVGDYLDSYDRSSEDQIETLGMVLGAVIGNPDKYTALMGNHERSYLFKDEQCSGYMYKTQIYTKSYRNAMLEHLQSYARVGDFLISHAGVSQLLLDENEVSLNEYLRDSLFGEVGIARGGTDPIGGLYWCDWFEEFEPVPDQPQIVGHSGYRPRGEYGGILQKGNSYNVDCYDHKKEFLLIDENSKVEIIQFDEL